MPEWYASGAVQPRERFVRASDDLRLLARTWDATDSEPRATLVLIDGLGCDGYIWKYVVQHHAGARTMLHLTHRGHGRSEVPPDLAAVSLAHVTADLVAHLARTDGALVLVGHSMGVQVALEVYRALAPAGRVAGLALLCGSYEKPISTFRAPPLAADETSLRTTIGNGAIRRFFDPLTSFALDKWDEIRPIWQRLLRAPFALDAALQELSRDLVQREDFQPCLDHLAAMDMRVFLTLARDMASHSAADLLPTIDAPTLVVGGALDRFCPQWISEEMFARLGACAGHKELVRLVNGSHTAPIEEPRVIEAALARLLARADTGARA